MHATDADHLGTLRALNARFIHNFVTNDVASHDAILHPRFECIMPTGLRLARADYLRAWAHGFDPDVIIYWDYRDERIALFGDVALVTSYNRAVRVREGAEVIGTTFYTDTYLLEDGKWLCVQAHITAIQPEHAPPDATIVRKYVRGRLMD